MGSKESTRCPQICPQTLSLDSDRGIKNIINDMLCDGSDVKIDKRGHSQELTSDSQELQFLPGGRGIFQHSSRFRLRDRGWSG